MPQPPSPGAKKKEEKGKKGAAEETQQQQQQKLSADDEKIFLQRQVEALKLQLGQQHSGRRSPLQLSAASHRRCLQHLTSVAPSFAPCAVLSREGGGEGVGC
jgi:hypothetical protein